MADIFLGDFLRGLSVVLVGIQTLIKLLLRGVYMLEKLVLILEKSRQRFMLKCLGLCMAKNHVLGSLI